MQVLHEDLEVVVCQAEGPRSQTCSLDDVQRAITSVLGAPDGHQWPIYRLMEAGRFYLHAVSSNTQKLKNKKIALKEKPFTIRFIPEKEERSTFRLLWVPPTLKTESLQLMMEELLGSRDVQVSRPSDRKDLGRVDVSVPRSTDIMRIPHYIPISLPNLNKISLIFVSVDKRRQRCHYCQSPEHWPGSCTFKETRSRNPLMGGAPPQAPLPVAPQDSTKAQSSYANIVKATVQSLAETAAAETISKGKVTNPPLSGASTSLKGKPSPPPPAITTPHQPRRKPQRDTTNVQLSPRASSAPGDHSPNAIWEFENMFPNAQIRKRRKCVNSDDERPPTPGKYRGSPPCSPHKLIK